VQQVDASGSVLDKIQGTGEPDIKPEEDKLEELPKEELVKKTLELKALADKNYDLYLRSEAELDNQKKRFRKEKEELGRFANEAIIKELLPVLDNLQNAVSFAEKENSNSQLLEGVRLTLKMLADVLAKAGVQEIKAVGEEFNPNLHQAMMNEETLDHKPGTVLRELQKGYLLRERLIRPSMVTVSKSPSTNESSN
jgi:molecular chaperone GrpE